MRRKLCIVMILALLLSAMSVAVFSACEVKENYSVSFVSDESATSGAMTAAEAREYFKSLPTREGYVFKGWYLDKDEWQQEVKSVEDIENYIVKGNVNVYARWIPIVDAITILFLDYNNASLLEYQTDRSDVNLSFIKPSEKPADSKYTYTFESWNCDMSDLTQAYYTATPNYKAELRVFDVKYYDEGKLIYTEKVKYGEAANAARVTPEKKPSTAQYDYTFAGWDGVVDSITADTNLNAKYEEHLRKYKVEFNYGDNKKDVKYVSYGDAAIAPQNLAKSDSAQYKYDFVGWDNVFDNIQADTVVNAKYASTTKVYEVSFWVDNTCVKSTTAPYGGSVTPPAQAVKTANDGYSYVFARWDKGSSYITGDTKVNAVFDKIPNIYSIKYIDWNGRTLYVDSVETGGNSTYGGDEPFREGNAQYEYQFTGWSDSDKLTDIRESFEVYAQYDENIRTFTVEFVYGDGQSKTLEDVEYGTDLTDEEPTDVEKTATSQYKYEFIGWDNSFDNIIADTTVNALYSSTVQVYEISFWVDDTCIQCTSELYGATVSAPTYVAKVLNDGFTYEFTGWDKQFNPVGADTKVNAIFDKISHTYTVKYIDWNGKLLYTDSVEAGESSTYGGDEPVRPSNPQYEYEFTGWSDQDKLSNVTESFEVYAQYREVERTYTVTFAYGWDEELQASKTAVFEDVAYGSSLIGQEPTDTFKQSSKQYDFEFLGWKGYYGYVVEDLTIVALYTETVKRYVVRFVNDGEVVRAQEIAYGDCPSAPNVVPIADTAQYKYTFLGWGELEETDEPFVADRNDFEPIDTNSTEVEGEITYTAVYLREIQKYTVTFYNEQILGTRVEVAKITVEYGSDATALAPEVTRDMTQVYVYTFAGWSKDITFISSHIEVDAEYTKDFRPYTVTYYNGDELYYTEIVKYSCGVANKPAAPTKASTVEFDFVFVRWSGGDADNILDDTRLDAYYDEIRRQYKVTFFDLSVYELLSSTTLYYGEKIEKTIERDGYFFDAWYRDPECTTMFNCDTEFVDGIMMLFGNTVIKGIEYKEETTGIGANKKTIGTITGYSGDLPNVVLPRVIKGLKMSKVAKEAFANNTVMESIYIPNTYSDVGSYVFKNIEELDIYTEAVNGLGLTYPYGWNPLWNSGSGSNRLVTNNVENIVTTGDYRYILVGGKNYAIIDKFVNNNSARAYIKPTLDYNKPNFVPTEHVDEKTGQTRNIYTIEYEAKTYNITTISQSAFSGCVNLASVFIPETITSVKKYAFSGISANIYIQRKKPAVGSVPSGWAMNWNSNRSGEEGERTVYWGVVGMDQVGDFTYIFMGDGTAIVTEYNGSFKMSLTIPSTVSYRSPDDANVNIDYTVTELGDDLFADGMKSLVSFSSITLPENLKKIGSKVFYLNTSLSSITLPETLEEIGSYAFVGTTSLKEIYIPAAIKKVGTFCFAGSKATIYVGKEKPLLSSGFGLYWNIKLEVSDIQNLTSLSGFAGMVFSPEYLPTYWNVAGKYTDVATNSGIAVTNKTNFEYLLYNDGTATLVSFGSAGMLHVTSYAVPETVTVDDKTYTVNAIGDGALSGNTSLTTIYIPASVTSIGSNAFAGCSKLTINTAHASQPSGWDAAFNPDGRPVNCSVQTASVE